MIGHTYNYNFDSLQQQTNQTRLNAGLSMFVYFKLDITKHLLLQTTFFFVRANTQAHNQTW